jgi:hypothetical protein
MLFGLFSSTNLAEFTVEMMIHSVTFVDLNVQVSHCWHAPYSFLILATRKLILPCWSFFFLPCSLTRSPALNSDPSVPTRPCVFDRELETGLIAILERDDRIPGYRSQVAEIVDRAEARQSIAQIAEELAIDPSTVERRLREVRRAANVAAEAEQLSGPCPPGEQNEGLGPQTPLEL